MKVSNIKPIGTHFKKENIFYATVEIPLDSGEMQELLSPATKGLDDEEKKVMDRLVEFDAFAATRQECDVFYKDEKGYSRFFDSGVDTFVGDGSDGKGKLINIVSVWEYNSEDKFEEGLVNDRFMCIICKDDAMEQYNQDYNINKTKSA